MENSNAEIPSTWTTAVADHWDRSAQSNGSWNTRQTNNHYSSWASARDHSAEVPSTWTTAGASRRTVDRPSSWNTAPVAESEGTGVSTARVTMTDPIVGGAEQFGLSTSPSDYAPVVGGFRPQRVLSVMGEPVGDGWVDAHVDDVIVTWRVLVGAGATVLPVTAPDEQKEEDEE
jgi:hypothetical protein